VTGTATLDGTLDIKLFGGFTGNVGQQFDIMNASSVSGDFNTVKTPDTYTFSNLANVPSAGDYQIEIASVLSTIDAANNVIVLNDFQVELDREDFTFEDAESISDSTGEEEDEEKRELACH